MARQEFGHCLQRELAAHIACEGELAMLPRLTAVNFLPPSWIASVRVGTLLILLTLQAFAGSIEQAQLQDARRLGNQGKFVEEIRLLDSLVHSAPAVLDDADRGMA